MNKRTASRTEAKPRSRARKAATPVLDRTVIWPRRKQLLTLSMAKHACDAAWKALSRSAAPIVQRAPDTLAGLIKCAVDLCGAVGMPEIFTFDPNADPKTLTKAPTLLELDQTRMGLVVRLTHRVHHSRDRLERAADALALIIEALGRRVAFREITHQPNMGGWRVSLRVAPAYGPVRSLIR